MQVKDIIDSLEIREKQALAFCSIYKDKLEYDDLTSNGSELTYELDKPVDSESMFSQYLQEYVAEEDVEIALPDAE